MLFKWSFNSPVLTTSLAIIALNVVVISFVFTINEVQLPIKPGAEWVVHKLSEFGPIKRVFDLLRNSVGLPTIKLTKERKRNSATFDDFNVLLYNHEGLPVFTKEQLALFDGTRPSKPVYLAILGRIYDVQKGNKHYAPGGNYHFFAGKDASRAFTTGDFSETGLTDDVSNIGPSELLTILEWTRFYNNDYEAIGVLEGLYYDANGEATKRLIELREEMEDALHWQENQMTESQIFPPCNSEWNKESGGRVWCTTKSGGIHRDWAGVPRRLYHTGSNSYRCACVKNFGNPLATRSAKGNRGDLDNPNLKEYDDCSHTSNSCKLGHNN